LTTIFLTAEWRRLVMLNFPIAPKALEEHVPRGTTLDLWEGTAYISVVAFEFLKTRVKGWPLPFHQRFEEINLRFYVRAPGPEGSRRGVVFIQEIVPKRAVALGARWFFQENYHACPMQSKGCIPHAGALGEIEYRWKHHGHWLSIAAAYGGRLEALQENSLQEFIAEHYWGYSRQRNGDTHAYQVEHPPWKVWSMAEPTLTGDIATFYGSQFADALRVGPTSAFVAEGSPVVVHAGERMANH
jgi:uncharacterized protein YqjF (DUF2071 family)